MEFEVSEYDISLSLFLNEKDPFRIQAEITRDFLSLGNSYPNYKGITFWSAFTSRNWMDREMPMKMFAPNYPGLFTKQGNRTVLYNAVYSIKMNPRMI